jgi:hypothetical protein
LGIQLVDNFDLTKDLVTTSLNMCHDFFLNIERREWKPEATQFMAIDIRLTDNLAT